MIVQCEKCRTKFRIGDERVSEQGVKVRCSRCAHVFVARRENSTATMAGESTLGPPSFSPEGPDTTRLAPSALLDLAARTAPSSQTGHATTEQAALALGFAGTEGQGPSEARTVQSALGPSSSGEPAPSWAKNETVAAASSLPSQAPEAAPPAAPTKPPPLPAFPLEPAPSRPPPLPKPEGSSTPASSPFAGPLPASRHGLPPLGREAPASDFPPPLDGFDAPAAGPGPAVPPVPSPSHVQAVTASEPLADSFAAGFEGFAPPPPLSGPSLPPIPSPSHVEAVTASEPLADDPAAPLGGALAGDPFAAGSSPFELPIGADLSGEEGPSFDSPDVFDGPAMFGSPNAVPGPEVDAVSAPPGLDEGASPLARIDLGRAAPAEVESKWSHAETTAIAAAYDEQSRLPEPAPEPVRLPNFGDRTGLWPSLLGALLGGALVFTFLPEVGAGLVDRLSRRSGDAVNRVTDERFLPESSRSIRPVSTHVSAYRIASGEPVLVVRGVARNHGDQPVRGLSAVALAMDGETVVARASAPVGVLLAPDVLAGLEDPSQVSGAYALRSGAALDVEIQPGGQWPFMVVFPEFPGDATKRDFVVEFVPFEP